MFDSIYSATVTPAQFFTMAAAALISGFLYSWIMSFRVRSIPARVDIEGEPSTTAPKVRMMLER